MNENENKYLSLKTVAGLYGYTRDHLGLVIRQGKLRGMKLGSYYVTTNDWMVDYLKKYANPDHLTAKGKFSNKFLIQALGAKENTMPQSSIKGGTKETRNKISRADAQNKFENNFFKDIQKELLPSLQELSATGETDTLAASLARRHAASGNPYIILPIRKMEEFERKEIFEKISDRDKSRKEPETT